MLHLPKIKKKSLNESELMSPNVGVNKIFREEHEKSLMDGY